MATLSSLQKQIEALQRKADAIRKAEKAEAAKKAKQLIAQYGLTAQDVGLDGQSGRGKPKGKVTPVGAAKSTGIAKYRDPQSGKTWTGHGKPPNWIAGVADRTKFLIDGESSAPALTAAATAKPVKTAKAGDKASKPAAKKDARAKSIGEQAAPAGKKAAKRSAMKTDDAKVQGQPAAVSANTEPA
jgi:DNA-binding protein H-NS